MLPSIATLSYVALSRRTAAQQGMYRVDIPVDTITYGRNDLRVNP